MITSTQEKIYIHKHAEAFHKIANSKEDDQWIRTSDVEEVGQLATPASRRDKEWSFQHVWASDEDARRR